VPRGLKVIRKEKAYLRNFIDDLIENCQAELARIQRREMSDDERMAEHIRALIQAFEPLQRWLDQEASR
jgi:hypothetical protein